MIDVYFNVDDTGRVIEFNLSPQPFLRRSAKLPKMQLTDFQNAFFDYCYRDETLVKCVDLASAKEIAKSRCLARLRGYYEVMFPQSEMEFRLDEAIRAELRLYARDNAMPTPVTDSLALASGEDIDTFRLAKLDDIKHRDITTAHLVGQKNQMFKLIEQCDDGEAVQSMDFNFSFPSYSNMRWR